MPASPISAILNADGKDALAPAPVLPASDGGRVALQVLASLQLDDQEGRMFANLVGISRTGMLVETAHVIAESTTVTLMFFLPGTRDRLAIRGVVRESVAAAEQRYLIGFVEMPEATRSIIDAFLGLRSQR